MKCVICQKEIKLENSIVCSEKCQKIRVKLLEIEGKYFPTHGCENCWGDLHQGCTEQCDREFKASYEFGKDFWSIIRLIYPKL